MTRREVVSTMDAASEWTHRRARESTNSPTKNDRSAPFLERLDAEQWGPRNARGS